MLNAIGLQGPGVDGFIKKYWPFLKKLKVPTIINIWGTTVDEYAEVARRFDALGGVGIHNLLAELRHNLLVNFVARLHHFAAQRIGLNNLRAHFAQHPGHSAFAAAQTTGKADAEHGLQPPSHAGGAHSVRHQHRNRQQTHASGARACKRRQSRRPSDRCRRQPQIRAWQRPLRVSRCP